MDNLQIPDHAAQDVQEWVQRHDMTSQTAINHASIMLHTAIVVFTAEEHNPSNTYCPTPNGTPPSAMCLQLVNPQGEGALTHYNLITSGTTQWSEDIHRKAPRAAHPYQQAPPPP